jgi:hypothetical protein
VVQKESPFKMRFRSIIRNEPPLALLRKGAAACKFLEPSRPRRGTRGRFRGIPEENKLERIPVVWGYNT